MPLLEPSHLQFSRAILSREFLTVTRCSILCNSVDRMLNADWSGLIDIQRATGQSRRMQLYRATLLHTRATKLREKIAGVTSVLQLRSVTW